MDIWDSYGNWDEIAKLASLQDVKDKITGNKKAWRSNYCSSALSYAFQYANQEYAEDYSLSPIALDFGCGLGRNLPLLKNYFPKVIGLDRLHMVERIREDYPELVTTGYASLYDSLEALVEMESFCVLYDSVVFQHFSNADYIAEVVDLLSKVSAFRTFISLHNFREHRRPPHVQILQDKGWEIWHTENETLSFEGALHSLLVLRRW